MFALALRNLTRHRRRTLVTGAALALGLVAVTVSRGFVNAQHRLMLEGAVRAELGAIQVHRTGATSAVGRSPLAFDFEDTPGLRRTLARVPGVTGVAPRLQFPAMVSLPDERSSWLVVTAIEPSAERDVTPRRFALVVHGRALEPADDQALWLEGDVARGLRLNASSDDESTWPALLAQDRDESLNGLTVRVVGHLEAAMPGDRRFGLIPLRAAQRLLRLEGRITSYALGVAELKDVDRVAASVRTALGPDYEVHTWAQVHPLLGELHGLQDTGFAVLSGLLLLVVVLTALNNMLMNVLERTREIGTLLAMGLKRRNIAALFLLEGALLGSVSGLVGVSLGAVVVELLARARLHLALAGTSVPAVLEFHVTFGFLATTLLTSVAATSAAALWPARRAAALSPIEALRSH